MDSPRQVASCFDEEKERDALENYFDAPLKPETADSPRREHAESALPEYIYQPVNHTAFSSSMSSSAPPLCHRLDVLCRDARGDQLKSGWDGSPNEMH